jgi:GDP-L-fucose synthase
MKILITGVTGLIGSNLYRLLKENNYEVDGISSKDGDLTSLDVCKDLIQGYDTIVHCAANTSNAFDTEKSPLVHVTPNVSMNANVMDAAYHSGVKKFIFISSSTIYPPSDERPVKEADYIFDEPYPAYFPVGWMKRYAEVLCDMYSNRLDKTMQCIVVRPANVFGPGDKWDFKKCHVTPATIRKVVDKHNPIEVWGDGSEIRDLIHVDDVSDALKLIIDKVDKYSIWNIGSNTSYSVNEVLKMCMEIEDYEAPIEYVGGMKPMIPIRRISSVKMFDELGWSCKYTLRDGLEKTISWYKEEYPYYVE